MKLIKYAYFKGALSTSKYQFYDLALIYYNNQNKCTP